MDKFGPNRFNGFRGNYYDFEKKLTNDRRFTAATRKLFHKKQLDEIPQHYYVSF